MGDTTFSSLYMTFHFFLHLTYLVKRRFYYSIIKTLNAFVRVAAFATLIHDPFSWFYLLRAFVFSLSFFPEVHLVQLLGVHHSCPAFNPAGCLLAPGSLVLHGALLFFQLQPGLSALPLLFASVLLGLIPDTPPHSFCADLGSFSHSMASTWLSLR